MWISHICLYAFLIVGLQPRCHTALDQYEQWPSEEKPFRLQRLRIEAPVGQRFNEPAAAHRDNT